MILHTKYQLSGRVVRSLLQISERWPCHTWPVVRMKFAPLGGKFGWDLLIYPILFSLRSSDMTEILLTVTLSRNPINQYQIKALGIVVSDDKLFYVYLCKPM